MQTEHAEINAQRASDPPGDYPPDDDLIARMNAIRNSSERHVVRMHAEAERLVDWREHVRSQPLVAVGAAAAAGFFLVFRSRGSQAPQVRTQASRPRNADTGNADTATEARVTEAATRTSLTSGAMAFIGTMAGNMVKQYAANYVKGKLAGVHHDRNTNEQSEVHSPQAGQSTGRW